MDNRKDTAPKLNRSIHAFMKSALKVCTGSPSMTAFALRSLLAQKRAAQRRIENGNQGLSVPPYMIVSVTDQCNLHCKGCYSKAQHRAAENEMSSDTLRSLIAQAEELGISFVFLAGGEPLTRPEILEITKDFPEVIFPLFTNGLLVTEEEITRLRRQKNVIPIISIEGRETDTDGRRGPGVYGSLRRIMGRLKEQGLFWGLSFTVTRDNHGTLTDEDYIRELTATGCRLFFFVEYIPVEESTEEMVITPEQRAALSASLDSFRSKFKGLFVSFPGDEESFGGCLAAGRGFVHVSAEGDLEPCPFSPFSDTNIKSVPLRDALQSELLSSIRQSQSGLEEAQGGCALYKKREWVRSLLRGAQ